MKKVLSALLLTGLIYSCGEKKEDKEKDTESSAFYLSDITLQSGKILDASGPNSENKIWIDSVDNVSGATPYDSMGTLENSFQGRVFIPIKPTTLAKYKYEYNISDLVFDEELLDHYDEASWSDSLKLTSSEIKELAITFTKDDLSEYLSYHFNSASMIDSLIEHDAYEEYEQSLDLGQIATDYMYPIEKYKIANETYLLVTMRNYHTYEACPYGYGMYFYGTLIKNGNIISTSLIAENSGGGDPPVSAYTKIYSEVTDKGTFKATYLNVVEEDYDGESTEERVEKEYIGLINADTVLISEKK